MKKLFITLSIALGLFGAVDANAGVLVSGGKSLVDQGRTAELNSWLTDICGATGSGTSYTLSSSNKPKNNVGDVYFVSINDYWKGNKSNYSIYDQINLGVDNIEKVKESSKQETSSGTFYTHEAKDVNKFFFIVRRENMGDYNYLSFGYYDEWSYVSNTSQGWDALQPCWNQLKDGAPFVSPHNCDTSLETNHYITLNAKDDYTSPHYNFTAYLYVPFANFKGGVATEDTYVANGTIYRIRNSSGSNRKTVDSLEGVYIYQDGEYVDIKTVYGGRYYQEVTSTTGDGTRVVGYKKVAAGTAVDGAANDQKPYVFFYDVDMQNPTAVKKTTINSENECLYNVSLNWNTAFDKYATHSAQAATLYDGMKEHYVLQRSYDNTNWEEVAPSELKEQVGNDVTTAAGKTWTDTGLKDFDNETKVLGYTVYYRVISKVEKTDGTQMSQTTSNVVTVLIPGTAPFKLSLQSGGTSKYDPKAETNTFTNTIVGTETEAHDEVLLAVGATLQLVRTTNAAEVIKTVTVENTSISLSALVAQIDNTGSDKNGTWTEEFVVSAGIANNAKYQLVLTTGENKYYSNYAEIAYAKAQNTAAKAYRSGTPDAATCADQELFHNVISFKPAMTGSGTGYFIYRYEQEGEEVKVVKVADVVDNGNGTFSHRGSSEQIALVNGQLSIVDYVATKPIAAGEVVGGAAASEPEAWAYSVAHYDDKANTYGSESAVVEYAGTNAELAVNLSASSTLQFAQDYHFLYQNATLQWSMQDQYAGTKPVKFEIWGKEVGEAATFAVGGYELVAEVAAEEGTTAYTFTTPVEKMRKADLDIPVGNKTAQDSDFKRYSYYVKAITTNEDVDQNVKEKNSASYAPSQSAGGIMTGIEGVEMAEADVTVADGIVTVKGVDGMVAIYSATGTMVASAEADGEVEIDATGLENGVYVVKAQNMKPTKILIK